MPAALLPLLSRLLTSLIGQIFIALGISAVTYKGVEKLQAYFVRMMQDEMGRFPSEALQLFYMAGGGVALNWIFGAVAFAFTFTATTKIGIVLKGK